MTQNLKQHCLNPVDQKEPAGPRAGVGEPLQPEDHVGEDDREQEAVDACLLAGKGNDQMHLGKGEIGKVLIQLH